MTQAKTNRIRALWRFVLLSTGQRTDAKQIHQILSLQITIYTLFVIRKFVMIRKKSTAGLMVFSLGKFSSWRLQI